MTANVKAWRYLSNGIARSFTGAGFQPVIAISHAVANYTSMALTHADIQPDGTINFAGNILAGVTANAFTSLDADGLSIGTHVLLNQNIGDPWNIHYMAALAGDDVAHGTYTGNGLNRNIVLPFTAGLVSVHAHVYAAPARRSPYARHKDMAGTDSWAIEGSQAVIADGITALGANQFSLGVNTLVNQNAQDYSYLAFKDGGDIAFGSYAGNDTADRLISTPSQPRFIWLLTKRATGLSDWGSYKYDNMPNVHSAVMFGIGGGGTDDLYAYYIRAITSGGFQVGHPAGGGFVAGDVLNLGGWSYMWMAIGQPKRAYSIVY